jgi:hypothetical protein
MKNRGFLLGIILVFTLMIFSLVSAGNLKVTEEHPFLVNGEWISASQLVVGDTLSTVDGKKVKITSLDDVVSNESFPVYNLEAGVYHNFVVDAGDGLEVVVHNSNLEEGFVLQRRQLTSQQIKDSLSYKKWLLTQPSQETLMQGYISLLNNINSKIRKIISSKNIFISDRQLASFDLDYSALFEQMKKLGYKFYFIPEDAPYFSSGSINNFDKYVIIKLSDSNGELFGSIIHELKHFSTFNTFSIEFGYGPLNNENFAKVLSFFTIANDRPTTMYYWASDMSYHFISPDRGLFSERVISQIAADEFNSFRTELNWFNAQKKILGSDSYIGPVYHEEVIKYYWDDYAQNPRYAEAMRIKPVSSKEYGDLFSKPSFIPEITCVGCGRTISDSLNFCPNCGIHLSK